jgi:hypothetical protein
MRFNSCSDVNNGPTDFVELLDFDFRQDFNFSCANVGANTVTLELLMLMEIVTETAIVTVEDKIAPVVLTKTYRSINAAGAVSIVAADVKQWLNR